MSRKSFVLPPAMGTAPLLPGHVRLYHQTGLSNAARIRRNGILFKYARGIEGPRMIWVAREPFYGKDADGLATVEFQWPEHLFDSPYLLTERDGWAGGRLAERVPPSAFIAVHEPWHHHARYIEQDPDLLAAVLRGEHDALLDMPGYDLAIRWAKRKWRP